MKRANEPAKTNDVSESPNKRRSSGTKQQSTLVFTPPHDTSPRQPTKSPQKPAPAETKFLIPVPNTKQWNVVGFFKSFKVADLPASHAIGIGTTTTGVYQLKKDDSVILVPKKKCSSSQIAFWDSQLKTLDEEKKKEEERKSVEFEEEQRRKYHNFVNKNKQFMRKEDLDSEEDDVFQEGLDAVNRSLEEFGCIDNQEWDDSLEEQYDSDPVPTFETNTEDHVGDTDAGAVAIGVIDIDNEEEKVVVLERKLALLESMTMPILLFLYRIYNNIHLQQAESFLTADLISEFDTADQHESFYRSLYEAESTSGAKFWKVTSVKEKPGVKGGENNPTIQMSGICKLNEMMVPDNFHLESKTHPFFVSWSRWFVKYHRIYCVSAYKTCIWEEVISNKSFVELASGIFQARRQNKSRTVDNKVDQVKQMKIAEFKLENGITAKGATTVGKKGVKQKQ